MATSVSAGGIAAGARAGSDSVEQAGRRPPILLTSPRSALSIMVRALTRVERAWIRFRSSWHAELRCWTGERSLGSWAAKRVNFSASLRSFFDSLTVIARVFRGLASIAWWL